MKLENIKRIYLSGPISGIADNNFPEFNRICKVLRNHGYYVYNPAEDHEGPMSWKYYMQKDIRIMLNLSLDAIIVMPGWNDSPGVDVELFNATKLLKIPAYEYVDLLRIDVNDPTYPEFALHKIKHITWNREVINE